MNDIVKQALANLRTIATLADCGNEEDMVSIVSIAEKTADLLATVEQSEKIVFPDPWQPRT